MKRPRSAAQIAASRRNGARSGGPKSNAAKAVSSQNAVKHGLFRKRFEDLLGLGEEDTELMEELQQGVRGDFDMLAIETVLIANRQLDRATAIVHDLQARATAALASPESAVPVAELIEDLARMARYQRRFRGQRDRALRGLAPPARTAD